MEPDDDKPAFIEKFPVDLVSTSILRQVAFNYDLQRYIVSMLERDMVDKERYNRDIPIIIDDYQYRNLENPEPSVEDQMRANQLAEMMDQEEFAPLPRANRRNRYVSVKPPPPPPSKKEKPPPTPFQKAVKNYLNNRSSVKMADLILIRFNQLLERDDDDRLARSSADWFLNQASKYKFSSRERQVYDQMIQHFDILNQRAAARQNGEPLAQPPEIPIPAVEDEVKPRGSGCKLCGGSMIPPGSPKNPPVMPPKLFNQGKIPVPNMQNLVPKAIPKNLPPKLQKQPLKNPPIQGKMQPKALF